MLGQAVGSYRITGRIGEGGMGAVYLAEHSLLGRTAAIKVLHPELSHQPDIVERFFNEARSASAIRHPGIVEIFDFGYAKDDSAYIVMEHLAGESLRERLDASITLDPERAASIGRQIASALQAAHDQSIIHRDLKPDNIFLVPDQEVFGGERAKILDFGIAKLAAGKGNSFRTQTGQLFGTPAYMAPEQCRGAGRVDHRADLYAVGCILYEMVCGRPPFIGEGGGEVLAAQIYEEPPTVRELAPHIPEALEAVIMRLLEKDPDARHASANELARALRQLSSLAGQVQAEPTPTPAPITAPRRNSEAMLTTLASAASATISSPPKGFQATRGKLWRRAAIGVGGAAVLGLLVVSVGALKARSAEVADVDEGGEVAAAPPPSDARPAAPRIIATELKLADAAPAAAASHDASPALAAIHLDSRPQQADIYRLPEREHIGTTPFTYEVPATGETLEFAVVRAGHDTELVEIVADTDSDHLFELTRQRAADPRPIRRPQPDRPVERRTDAHERAPQPDEDARETDAPSDRREAPLNPFTRERRTDGDEVLNPFER
jgi:eukaryotic-like serine/threonine-protein kinase